MNSDEDDINLLINELSSFEIPTKTREVVQQTSTSLSEKDLQQYFLDKTKALIDTGLATVQDLAPNVTSSGDAREIDALSKLMASTAQALDTLQKTALIDKKANRDEQLEQLRFQGKKEIAQMNKSSQHVTNNNILVASREEIMKKLFANETEVFKIDDK